MKTPGGRYANNSERMYGAGYRVRTDDIFVGNETFYH